MELSMSQYIVCQKKRNNPRMDIRICQKKCDIKNECKEYIAICESMIQNEAIQLSEDAQSIQREAA